jgi:hypothetical protein
MRRTSDHQRDETSLTATTSKAVTKREAIFPPNRHALYEKHDYSATIRSGELLFVYGQVGSREDGSPEPDFYARSRVSA